MKKIIFLALFLLAVNSIFAQKANQKPDGSWVLDGVQMTQDDKKALLNLLRPYETTFKLTEAKEGRVLSTYGKANISSVTIDNKTVGDERVAGTKAIKQYILRDFFTKYIYIIPSGSIISKDVQSKVDAIMTKYAR